MPAMLPAELDWTIECRNVTFWYPSDPEQKPIFKQLNLVKKYIQLQIGMSVKCGICLEFFLKIKNKYPEIDLNWIISGKRTKHSTRKKEKNKQ